MKIDSTLKNYIPKISDEEYAQLEKNLLENGCREPLVTWNNILLDGHNRYKICTKHDLKFKTVTVKLANKNAAFAWMIRNQFGRRNISLYDRGCLALLLKPLVEKEAAARMKSGKKADPKDNCPEGQARDIVAKEAGMSGKTLERIEYIENNAPQEIKAALKARDITINKSYTATRRYVQEKENQKKVKRKPRRIDGKYDVIVIDPPWPMEKIERDDRPNQSSSLDYPTMTEAQLQDLKIPHSKDCHLFVWTTHKFLPMALRLLPSWGFKYVLAFVWHKPNGYQPFGLPKYNCEFALYCRLGSPKFVDLKAFNTCFNAPQGSHSEKPSFFYEMIARVTDGRRLDMFSRRKIDGFDAWGNESL